jgi:formylglycine-generating enzyme required for sulfatase activity
MLRRPWLAPIFSMLIASMLIAALFTPASHAPWAPGNSPTSTCDGVETQVGDDWRCLRPKDAFRDCDDCPEMVVVPAGSFMMGSSPAEIVALGKQFGTQYLEVDAPGERPQRNVTIARPFAVGRFEVTFSEWEACVAAGGCKHKTENIPNQVEKIISMTGGRGKRPVANVSWNDITKEYLPWLSRKTGKSYRLLTEAEWEYAARAGSTTRFHFGNDERDLCTYRNVADLTVQEKDADLGLPTKTWTIVNCRDGHAYVAPVGSFKANDFGLYDMHGNVWELVQDCARPYAGAPVDGSAAPDVPGCFRVARGGSWVNSARHARSASWQATPPALPSHGFVGFRLGRTL